MAGMRSLLLLLLLVATVRAGDPPAEIPGVDAEYDIPYAEHGHERQKLDLYVPSVGTNLPVIVWIHGGGWTTGDKSVCPTLEFTRAGFAAASIGYRLSQHAPFPAQIEDCKAAIRWLRAHAAEYRIDPNRIGVWGASAGGHLAALLGTSGGAIEFDLGENTEVPSSVQAVCDWCGPTDFTKFFEGQTPDPSSGMYQMCTQLFAGRLEQRRGLVERANPITFVSADDPPFLIVHGSLDSVVPISQSRLLSASLTAAGVPAELSVVQGGAHAFWSPQLLGQVLAFFERTLKHRP
jgi:acetyl esterase/lipase